MAITNRVLISTPDQRIPSIVAAQEAITYGLAVTRDGWIYNGTTHNLFAGFALDDYAIGEFVEIGQQGVIVGESGAAITAGAILGVNASGLLVPVASGVPTTLVVGTAMNAATGAGEEVRVNQLTNGMLV
jgi:hypothetical protein